MICVGTIHDEVVIYHYSTAHVNPNFICTVLRTLRAMSLQRKGSHSCRATWITAIEDVIPAIPIWNIWTYIKNSSNHQPDICIYIYMYIYVYIYIYTCGHTADHSSKVVESPKIVVKAGSLPTRSWSSPSHISTYPFSMWQNQDLHNVDYVLMYYIYICICTVFTCIYVNIYTYIDICISIYIYMYMHLHICNM